MSWIAVRAMPEKPVNWVASAKKDYQSFPQEVQADMGYALRLAQLGAKHPNAKPWKGDGPGVLEIVEDHRGRHLSRDIYGSLRRCRVCAPCVPEEIEDWNQDAARGREFNRRSPETRSAGLRKQAYIMRSTKDGHITRGISNVFEDLGFQDAAERQTKTHLALAVNELLNARKLKQREIAELLGIPQPKVSALKHFRLDQFSVERLMEFLTALNHDVEILIRPRSSSGVGHIAVLAVH
jgi:predicted XRE-type DNA-binding protein